MHSCNTLSTEIFPELYNIIIPVLCSRIYCCAPTISDNTVGDIPASNTGRVISIAKLVRQLFLLLCAGGR